ncbi:MipA/OmpV family protein [Roseibium sp.]|uniref:MipA/OmpV family protein n=1 Tax=Roseibium sp. TaxID=1936156 RepID=UPI003A9741DA
MTTHFARCLLGATALAALIVPAQAQDAYPAAEKPVRQYVMDLGIGGMVQPRYEGADSYLIYPFPIISVSNFYFPGLGQIADGKKRSGFFVYPSFNFIGERSASDSADLTGTKTVNWALELGLGGGFRTDHFRAFAELRQGINGHHGQVGQLGADAIFFPMDKVEWSIGPRTSFATGDYMDTYFGVTAAEAAASGGRLTAYDPDAGFKSVGLATRISYNVTDDVRLHLQGGYDRLVGDAADSPITKAGDKNQFSIGLGATYRFSFDLFN